MSFKRIRHLDDLAFFGRNLLLVCTCGRRSVIDRRQLIAWASAHRWRGDLAWLVERMRCAGCRRRSPSDWGSTEAAADADLAVEADARRRHHLRRAALYRRLARIRVVPR